MSLAKNEVVATGLGIITPLGIGMKQFATALKDGSTNFSATEFELGDQVFRFPLGRANNLNLSEWLTHINVNEEVGIKARRFRNLSVSTSYGLYCGLEAWIDAGLSDANIDLTRVAIVSSGSNTQQATLESVQERYRDKLQFLNPNYALNFFDTDIVGVLSETLGIKGEGHAIAAASASGNMGIIQGHRLISSKKYDVVLVVAPLMDLSVYEYQAFTALGAMAKIQNDSNPAEMCRPFDVAHNGFVYGQCAGCLILESHAHAKQRGKKAYGSIPGYGVSMDANRNPNPSVEGEYQAMAKAMSMSHIKPSEIRYVNTHGTASIIGDQTEVEALVAIGLAGVKSNSTKSLVGHALSAAGVVEAIATLIQMKDKFLHVNNNLKNPITDKIDWILDSPQSISTIPYAISNSFGFGGIYTSIIIKNNEL